MDLFALSQQQRHIWDRSPRHVTLSRRRWAVRLDGRIDELRLRLALASLGRRHDMLRVRLHHMPELRYPLMEIAAEATPLLRMESSPVREPAQLLAQSAEDWSYPGTDPLVVTLWPSADGLSFLTLDAPPFCIDAASIQMLVKDLAALYAEGTCDGEPLQYLQYAAWQATEGAADDSPMAAREETIGAWHQAHRTIDIPQSMWRREIFMLAWHRVYRAVSRGDDHTLCGVETSGRFSNEFDGAVGPYSYCAPMRVSLPANVNREQAEDVLRAQWAEVERRSLPQEWARTAEQMPQFLWLDCRFKVRCGELTWTLLGAGMNASSALPRSFVLEVMVTDRDATLLFAADQAAASVVMMRYWLDRVETVLRGWASGTDGGLVGDQETQSLCRESSGEPLSEPEHGTVLDCIDSVARRWPDRIAVRYGKQSLSYKHLLLRADALARRLRETGVREQMCVGVLIPRGTAQVVAVFGIMRAGGVYVALDPQAPLERLRSQLSDCQASVVVSERRGSWSQLEQVLEVPVEGEGVERGPCVRSRSFGGQELAYVLYTSGSTGQPKGVAITQRGLLFSTVARLKAYEKAPAVMLWTPALFFDSSVAGLFWTLLSGGVLLLPSEEQSRSALDLAQLVSEQGVTHWLSVPSLYAAVLESAPQYLRGLQSVIVAGESCPQSLVHRHTTSLKDVPLYNEYGPTEVTVWCTWGQLKPDVAVTIGKAIPGARVHVMGTRGELMPYEARGELWAGGAGVARGYLGRARETAHRFVPDAWGEGGARAYRTGDWGWREESGELRFVGRTDEQVKLHGFRIELAEVEAAVGSHAHVAEAAAVVRDEQLLAYVTGRAGTQLSEEALRTHAKERLPAYMVPAVVIVLEQLPRLPNGKIDRQSLNSAVAHARELERDPEGPTETALAQLWKELLVSEHMGAQRDFFTLGGHSLLAMRMIAQAQQQFGVALSFDDVLRQPTVEAIARRIDALSQKDQVPSEAIAVIEREFRIDLQNEALLDASIVPSTRSPPADSEPQAVLLTGATGFLGAFLLRELLRQTSAQIYCLVRAGTQKEARGRLHSSLERYELGGLASPERVRVLRGDISKSALGLDAGEFQTLARSVDAIYHSGAVVNFVQSYSALKPVNVLGTRQVLRLACTHKLKPVHFVSTLSVFGNESPKAPNGFSENEFPDADANLGVGYNQSKWVAERLMRNAASRGVPVGIYRPATIGGDGLTGAWNTDDFVCRLIKGCMLLGAAPEEEHPFVIVPVDQVSKAIVALSLRAETVGQTYHFSSPNAITSSMLLHGCESRGYRIDRVPFAEWRRRAHAQAESAPDHVLYPLLPLLDSVVDDPMRTPAVTPRRYDDRQTCRALRQIGIELTPADVTHVERYFSYFSRQRFLSTVVAH